MVALVAGCETATRIGLGLDFPEFRKRGWHGPGVFGLFGSAAAVGRLRKFDGETMARTFGLAGSQSAGTFAAWGTPTVKFHQCRGALSGVMAALLAEQKFVATKEFLTAKDGGLLNTYTNGGKPQEIVADLGKRWEMEQIALRLWPSASTIQGMITATFDLIEKHNLKPADVRKIRVAMGKTAVDLHGIFPRYKAKFEALLSTHYAAAVILHDRELTLAQFEPARYDDPALRKFSAENVEVVADASLTGVQAVVEAEGVAVPDLAGELHEPEAEQADGEQRGERPDLVEAQAPPDRGGVALEGNRDLPHQAPPNRKRPRASQGPPR